MTKINQNYLRLNEDYLFSLIAQKTNAYQQQFPDREVIKLSIGDVSQPLPKYVLQAMQNAVNDLGAANTFRGYGPETGYPWLKTAIIDYYQQQKNVMLTADEIIISDGAKSDIANLLDLFAADNQVVMCDPVYPVYLESNLTLGRKPKFLSATPENNFLPMPDAKLSADIIYLCNPGNPTGMCYSREQLQQWVNYALKHQAIILYDAAYESFITDPNLPSSIYQIDGAKECAIEICSLSKTAGFTGLRCGYTIVPHSLVLDRINLNQLWRRRQSIKFNGASYITQRGAAAVFTSAGWQGIRKNLAYYQRNVRLICQTLDQLGWQYVGGINSPYIWVRCPGAMSSWEFFDYLLTQAGLVCTPGVGFGQSGEGYIRLTGFNNYLNTKKACQRLLKIGTKI